MLFFYRFSYSLKLLKNKIGRVKSAYVVRTVRLWSTNWWCHAGNMTDALVQHFLKSSLGLTACSAIRKPCKRWSALLRKGETRAPPQPILLWLGNAKYFCTNLTDVSEVHLRGLLVYVTHAFPELLSMSVLFSFQKLTSLSFTASFPFERKHAERGLIFVTWHWCMIFGCQLKSCCIAILCSVFRNRHLSNYRFGKECLSSKF